MLTDYPFRPTAKAVARAGLSTRPSGAPSFDPSSLSSLSWYDPSDIPTMWQDSARTTPVTADGDPVGCIDDKSGNGYHAIQTTTSRKPQYKTSGGLSWLLFDGIDDALIVSFAIAQPWTRISGLEQISWVNNSYIYTSSNSTNGSIVQSISTPTIRMSSGTVVTINNSTLSKCVLSEYHNGASSSAQVDNLTLQSPIDVGTNVANGISIGANQGVVNRSNIAMYQLIMVGRALTSPEYENTKSFVANKTGVTL